MEGSVPFWQPLSLSFLLGWLFSSSLLNLTRRFRSLTQPWITKRVQLDTPFLLKIQRNHNGFLDAFFSVLSCAVSAPFYIGFLPVLFWSGHSKLARQATILLAFCDYAGNAMKDLVSAPRPSCPSLRRVTATDDEKENAMEYGLPSSHALNTVCLSGYLLYYFLTCGAERDNITILVGFVLVFTKVMLIAIARMYLGMHSLLDVMAGISFGVVILAFWIKVHGYVDDFVINGQNGKYQFQSGNLVGGLICLGPVWLMFLARVLGRKPAKRVLLAGFLPNTRSSSCYIPSLKSKADNNKHLGYLHKLFSLFDRKEYDIDTGIRFIQYAGLGWSVVDLVPSLFSYLSL
ncbi:lipid phosphate phosphatase delta-like [Asparagus officinalis]|uniref:lipid phosphate phosphatase delta-like n=1 Tax=Asparagus officinalis TaxID=4686 RepID=UPI00098E002B|nr:lipid phosphate phosphatase delta-like [Asparagus officinalis]